MMYLVAVSGGVDSVVLLDMLAKLDLRKTSLSSGSIRIVPEDLLSDGGVVLATPTAEKDILDGSGEPGTAGILRKSSRTDHNLIVAHVDHGIREDSAADARFVGELAKKYDLPFVSTRFELGVEASEEKAREVRYGFLFDVAKKQAATIVTAHHQGDILETIAINLSRGTGWRGLAVLNRQGIVRPLLGLDKANLYEYALKHRLEWVEDSTNASVRYHRNRLRRVINSQLTPEKRQAVLDLRTQQLQLHKAIGFESQRVMAGQSRHFFTQIDPQVARELLGTMIVDISGIRPTRPQLHRALLAIKTAKPRTIHQIGSRIQLRFTSRQFEIEVV